MHFRNKFCSRGFTVHFRKPIYIVFISIRWRYFADMWNQVCLYSGSRLWWFLWTLQNCPQFRYQIRFDSVLDHPPDPLPGLGAAGNNPQYPLKSIFRGEQYGESTTSDIFDIQKVIKGPILNSCEAPTVLCESVCAWCWKHSMICWAIKHDRITHWQINSVLEMMKQDKIQ